MGKVVWPLPVPPAAVRLNVTLHGRSVNRPEDVEHHNVCLGYDRPGVGDAIDLFVPRGSLVVAMVPCVVMYSKKLPGGGVYTVCGSVGLEHHVKVCYCHLSLMGCQANGTFRESGQKIGYVGHDVQDPHLHLEVWVNGVALSGHTPRILLEKIKGLLG